MTDNFEQTVNLKEKMLMKAGAKPAASASPKDQIERLYSEERDNLKKITKPPAERRIKLNERYLRIGVIALAVLLVVFIAKAMLFSEKPEKPEAELWYAVKLVNGEIFYGQVSKEDKTKLIMKNVYYNYDQIKNGTSSELNPAGNIRLVKLGKESYGPDGTREILQDKVIYKDPLKNDSKVLKAILGYEK